MKKAIKRAAIPCLIYWAILLTQLLFQAVATEGWMLPALLIFVIFRLMLWLSPLVLSALCWISGFWNPSCKPKHIVLTNLLVLILNIIPYFLWYLESGSWY